MRWVHHWTADRGAEDPTLTERQGMVLLEFHGTVHAENATQHSLATDRITEED